MLNREGENTLVGTKGKLLKNPQLIKYIIIYLHYTTFYNLILVLKNNIKIIIKDSYL